MIHPHIVHRLRMVNASRKLEALKSIALAVGEEGVYLLGAGEDGKFILVERVAER
jgi:hypothetical protein